MKRGLKTRGGFKSASTLKRAGSFARRILKSDPVQAELKKTRRGMTAESILDKLTLGDLQGVASKAVPALINHVGKHVGSSSSRHRGAVIQDGAYGGIKSSSSIYKLHNKRKSQLQDQQYTYLANRYFRLNCAQNQQNCADANFLLGGWTGATLPVLGSYPMATLQNFMETLYQPTTTNPSGAVGAAIPTKLTFKLDLKSIRTKTQIANASTMGCIVTVYECIPKLDTTYTGGGSATYGLGDFSPFYAFSTGMQEQAFSTGFQASALTLDVKPTSSLRFNTYWKVFKETIIELPPGAVHIHNSHYEINALLNYYRCTDTKGGLQGITPCMMYTLRGLPVNDSVTLTNVASSLAAVDITMDSDYRYSAPALSGQSMINNTIYPSVTIEREVGVPTAPQTVILG